MVVVTDKSRYRYPLLSLFLGNGHRLYTVINSVFLNEESKYVRNMTRYHSKIKNISV